MGLSIVSGGIGQSLGKVIKNELWNGRTTACGGQTGGKVYFIWEYFYDLWKGGTIDGGGFILYPGNGTARRKNTGFGTEDAGTAGVWNGDCLCGGKGEKDT